MPMKASGFGGRWLAGVVETVDGRPQFYKDGSTDLRGKFDYLSLSSATRGKITRFSLRIMSAAHGATVMEVAPP